MGILRTRMEHDLVVRGRPEHTRRAYLRAVADLARYHHRSPDQLTDSEVQQYLRYLIEERCLAWASCRQSVGALRFFYEVTLGRPRRDFSIPLPKAAKRLPQILSREEVARVLEGTQTLKPRALLMTTYAAGLRVPTPSATVAPQRCPLCGGGPVRIVEILAPLRGIPP